MRKKTVAEQGRTTGRRNLRKIHRRGSQDTWTGPGRLEHSGLETQRKVESKIHRRGSQDTLTGPGRFEHAGLETLYAASETTAGVNSHYGDHCRFGCFASVDEIHERTEQLQVISMKQHFGFDLPEYWGTIMQDLICPCL